MEIESREEKAIKLKVSRTKGGKIRIETNEIENRKIKKVNKIWMHILEEEKQLQLII